MRLLLVDDEPIVHDALGPYLRDCGHSVDSATDGLEGLRAIEAQPYDAALVDVRMPGLDGIGLLARARQLRPGMAVIFMTGHGDAEMEELARRHGVAGFFVKPIRLRELERVLNSVSPDAGDGPRAATGTETR